MRRPGLLIAPLLLAGLVGSVVVLKSHEGNAAFVLQQQSLSSVPASLLERFVASAPDPQPGTARRKGLGATCTPAGSGELRNPWSCTVRYPRAHTITYRVTITPQGRVKGVDRTGQLVVYGCCVGPHPTE